MQKTQRAGRNTMPGKATGLQFQLKRILSHKNRRGVPEVCRVELSHPNVG
jgi:hypothetical protein